jgi:hypothetical protein
VDESFLHFIWQLQYFEKESLQTTQREGLSIFRAGAMNTNAGPDFQQAKLRIEEVEWHGDVEIHFKSSDWNRHNHHTDEAYNKVILHVVWEDDQPVRRSDGTLLPTLVLKNKVAPAVLTRYYEFLENKKHHSPIPCSKFIHQVPELSRLTMVERALIHRLEKKAAIVYQLLAQNRGDWEETAYQLIFKNFGFKTNSETFLALSKALPKKFVAKHQNQPFQIEALLLGQAGFLDESPPMADDYWQALKKEHDFLSKKYGMVDKKLASHQWKFMRMRPANFPTVRMAQLAQLLANHHHLFSLFKDFSSYQELHNALKVQQSDYWQSHYQLGVTVSGISGTKKCTLGNTSIKNIIINTAVPLLVAYTKAKDEEVYQDKALDLLEKLPAESNKITRLWEDIGIEVKTAFDAQALIELYNSFCSPKKCLSCNIGVAIIKSA